MAAPGGEKKKRGEGNTRPGPLYPLLALALSQVNEDTLKSLFDREALAGKHQAARADDVSGLHALVLCKA